MPELNYEAWEEFLEGMPQAHLLQSGSWGELKRDFGWDIMRIADWGGGDTDWSADFIPPAASGVQPGLYPARTSK